MTSAFQGDPSPSQGKRRAERHMDEFGLRGPAEFSGHSVRVGWAEDG